VNTRGETDSDEFYDSDPLEPNQLYQGEILTDLPILSMPKPGRWQLLRTKSGKRVDEALEQGNLGGLVKVLDSNQSQEQWQADKTGDYAMAILEKRPALVLNQTCDVQHNHFLQVAPIYSAEAVNIDLDKLKRSEIYDAFWIAKNPPEIPEESLADLELIQAVHKSYIKRIRPNQHFRLNSTRIRALQRTITRYFGRPNSFDSRSDIAPRTGVYMCVRCFYMDARITSMPLTEGGNFSACETCGGTGWVLKGR
jgi:hypothetical protein